jgi:toxin ParE1/3/4
VSLVDTFQRLSERPHLARERTELTPPMRKHPRRSHLIVYAKWDGGILIIRVMHRRQDWERHL